MQDKISLENKIKYHNQKYWEENNPEISDFEYDRLVEQLKKIDPNSDVIYYNKNRSMLSLRKIYSVNELKKWIDSVKRNDQERFLFEPKLDGVSGVLQNGQLFTKGENISNKICLIRYVNKKITALKDVTENVRGEIIIPRNIFKTEQDIFKRNNGENFKTARHACSSILMGKKINKIFKNKIHLVDFEAFSKEYSIQELLKLNFKKLEKQIKDPSIFNYDVDGFIIKLADKKYSTMLGSTSHHPRGEIAYKFQSEMKKTILKDIVWSVGKYSITPIGILKPINLYNTTVSKVALHNAKFIIDNDLKINDIVTIEKAGEIIPHIVKSQPGKNRKSIVFQFCPNCGSKLLYKEPDIHCSNPDCEGTYLKKLYDSITRLGIQTLGYTTLEKLNKKGFDNIIKILNIKKDELISIERFGEKSAINLLNEINKIKNNSIEDWKLLSSLNIRGIGRSMSQKILKNISIDKLITLKPFDLEKIENIGKKRALEIYYDLKNKKNDLLKLCKLFPRIKNSNKSKIKYICMTGKGKLPRTQLKELCLKKNYYVKDSVTKDISLVIANDINSQSLKIRKAKELGIQIVSYDDFEKYLTK